MKKRPIIFVDMDDVICEGGFLYLLNLFLDTNYTKKDFKNNYYMDEIIEDEKKRKELIKTWTIYNPYGYACKLIPGVQEYLKKLNEIADIYICTASYFPDIEPIFSSQMFEKKYNFLIKNLRFLDPGKFIFCSNKNLFSNEIDFFIDDRLENLQNNAKNKILFKAYHNEGLTIPEDVVFLETWQEIYAYVTKNIN